MKNNSLRQRRSEDKDNFLGDGKVALGAIIGVSISVFIALLVSKSFESETQSISTLQSVGTLATLAVAVTSLFFSANALQEQRRIRQAGTDPVLVAHFGQREDARSLITFNVSNVGAGAAMG